MELLRIVSMFMVLMFHTNFHTIGYPSFEDASLYPIETFSKFVVQGLSVICVNVFVLLSGWFGIRPTLRGGTKFVFQVFFFTVGPYLIAVALGKDSFSISSLAKSLLLDDSAWFVKAYFCLYLIAPILNMYAENADRKGYRMLLVSFFVFQFLYGWAVNAAYYFEYGLSVTSFVGLYLLARYVRRFTPNWTQLSKAFDITIFIGIVLLMAVSLSLIGHVDMFENYYHTLIGHMYSYNNPIVILECVSFLLFFSKLSFKSKVVNFVAASCFSVLFIHGNKYFFPYTERVIGIYNHFPYFIALSKIIIMNLIVFAAAILMDQARKAVWNVIDRLFFQETIVNE